MHRGDSDHAVVPLHNATTGPPLPQGKSSFSPKDRWWHIWAGAGGSAIYHLLRPHRYDRPDSMIHYRSPSFGAASVRCKPSTVLRDLERPEMSLDLHAIRTSGGSCCAIAGLAVTRCFGYSPRVQGHTSAIGESARLNRLPGAVQDLERGLGRLFAVLLGRAAI